MSNEQHETRQLYQVKLFALQQRQKPILNYCFNVGFLFHCFLVMAIVKLLLNERYRNIYFNCYRFGKEKLEVKVERLRSMNKVLEQECVLEVADNTKLGSEYRWISTLLIINPYFTDIRFDNPLIVR